MANNDRDAALLASAWELLAFSLRYPTRELAEAVTCGEWVDAACEIAGALGLVLPQGWADGLPPSDSALDSDAFHRSLRAEATRLFVGAPAPAVSPYEGVWRAADDGVRALLFVNPHSMDVERFCRTCGLGRPEGTNEPLDHVATECELLEYLAALKAGIAEPSERMDASNYPGGSPSASYALFLEEHVLVWMPRFAEGVAVGARQPFYRAVAALLSAMLQSCDAKEETR